MSYSRTRQTQYSDTFESEQSTTYRNVPGFNIDAQADRIKYNFESLPYWEAYMTSKRQIEAMTPSWWMEYVFTPKGETETTRLLPHSYTLKEGKLWNDEYGSISELTTSSTRNGADKKSILAVEEFLSQNNEPGTTAIQISPQGPTGSGKLPETQILLWQITDQKTIDLVTIRTDQSEQECRNLFSALSSSKLHSKPGTFDSYCEIAATPVGFTKDKSPDLHQVVSAIQSSANREFRSLDKQVADFSEIKTAWDNFAKGQAILGRFSTQLDQIAESQDIALLIAQAKVGMYQMVLELSVATHNRTIYTATDEYYEYSSLSQSTGCEQVSSSETSSSYSSSKPYVEIWKDGYKYIVVYNCGSCKEDLGKTPLGLGEGKGLFMKSGDYCPCCHQQFLCA